MASSTGQYVTSGANHVLEKPASPQMIECPGRKTIRTAVCISYVNPSWSITSNSTILFNKWLIDTRRLPILLTCWHLFFATIATQVLAHTTKLLDSRKNKCISPHIYPLAILPISIFYSLSLVTSNIAYLYLSIPFIQILKTTAPAVMLFVAWVAGTANPTFTTILNILWVVGSVMLASTGEIQFSLVGFLYQMGSIVADDGLKMDPLVGLYYLAPACCLMNFLIALSTNEVANISWHAVQDVGAGLLFLNALIAFMLNISSVYLVNSSHYLLPTNMSANKWQIGQTSGLVMTLAGILKNILLIIVSVMIWRTQITVLQAVGYTSALAGLIYYSLGYNQLPRASQAGSVGTFSWWKGTSAYNAGSMRLKTRRAILAALIIMTGLVVLSPRMWSSYKQDERIMQAVKE
ncbi:triose-phosphate transporter family protein [Metarhizium robertsii]|uniref:Triose-phosphate transporter family protein n=1 Tax=Metarhizium robertsii TaxID=568076 RepID=A0A0A1UP83_9HYPO|nr:triose-phosphate transporter family protein [Metarhizium robertsii]